MGYSKSSTRGKFIVINAYIKGRNILINNLILHLKELEKKNKLNPKLEEERK